MASQNDDPFDSLLTLEDTLYTTAHSQGISDGARAGRIEGRIFGLEKGFEKFSALGEFHGRGAVWGSRLSPPTPSATPKPTTTVSSPSDSQTQPATEAKAEAKAQLPGIQNASTRLPSNVSLLYHLTDPLTFSTSNTEADVADFDDRFKRAGAKAKVIERIIGETSTTTTDSKSPERGNATGKNSNVRLEGEGKGGRKGDDSMEDFGGSRLIG
ncbi:hypothetical protein BU25DRAFT_412513 [Macroventuria anomochaeta]|uniref:Uncharacterized protein n=1 Tax=Macroventuria anomochaeta TaxID=301207 RepID=A0ACB6RWE5_9PLEO|nr:uncharacterized protein BU25DRAFT_412513 [Macroventuria anomochaeta]KAF2625463.1 hypothetical protein BU25DRAFT_412513 [Macroventuria anomochaeta]